MFCRSFSRWQQNCTKDVMFAILKFWRRIKNISVYNICAKYHNNPFWNDGALGFFCEMTSWPSWQRDVMSDVWLRQSRSIHSRNNPAKFHSDTIWDGWALGFFQQDAPTRRTGTRWLTIGDTVRTPKHRVLLGTHLISHLRTPIKKTYSLSSVQFKFLMPLVMKTCRNIFCK